MHRSHSHWAIRVDAVARPRFNGDNRTILSDQRGLMEMFEAGRLVVLDKRPVLGCDDVSHFPANQLRNLIAQELSHTLVDVHKSSGLRDDDAIKGRFSEGAKPCFALLQHLLPPHAFGDVP